MKKRKLKFIHKQLKKALVMDEVALLLVEKLTELENDSSSEDEKANKKVVEKQRKEWIGNQIKALILIQGNKNLAESKLLFTEAFFLWLIL